MQTVTAHLSRRCRPLLASAVLVPALVVGVESHTSAAAGRAASSPSLAQTRVLGNQAEIRPSYGWPLKPFNRQHPVRGYLNDPRNGDGHAKSFHFGIDISAPDGTAVYAVEAGEVFLEHGEAVAVRGERRTFGYWHVVPVVRDRQSVRAHQLLGHVARGARHVHFAERVGDEYRNPLRRGGIGPYVDRKPPTIASVHFYRNGRELDANVLKGRVDIVVEAFDTPSLLVPRPWSRLPVTPARIRWSLASGSRNVVAPRIAVDFRGAWLRPRLYDSVYASGTRQNHVGAPGHYRFYLARGFRTSQLSAGIGRLQIEAVDTRGNRATAQLEISTVDSSAR